ncbi:Chromosome-partitioning protein Spo0J [Myxococcaceae bacterium]|nr:Chromosome-partitioning protein Spo0J [Myxococcaceae bacterium]
MFVPLDLIDPSPYQNRTPPDEETVAALAESIRRDGLNNPVLLRKKEDGRYELMAGETRARACRLLGQVDIAAFVRVADDARAARVSVLDNLEHRDLSDYEKYKGLAILLGTGAAESLGDLASLCGWSKTQVHRLMAYGKLPKAALDILDQKPGAVRANAIADLAKLIDDGVNPDIVIEAIRRSSEGRLDPAKAGQWAIAHAAQKPEPRVKSKRAVVASDGRMLGMIERTPRGLLVKGEKGLDLEAIEAALAEWLASYLEKQSG